MTRIDRREFVSRLSRDRGRISLTPDVRRDLASAGVNRRTLDRIAGDDHVISGAEFNQLYDALAVRRRGSERVDGRVSEDLFRALAERVTRSGAGATPPDAVPSTRGSARPRSVGVRPATFDPHTELARLGVRPVRLRPPIDVTQFTPSADGRTASFSYTGGSGPAVDIRMVPFSEFDSSSSAGARVANPEVRAWLEATAVGTTQNFENTDLTAVGRFIDRFAHDNPEVLAQLGITDLDNLTPRQAANLAGLVTTMYMEYNRADLAVGGNMYSSSLDGALGDLDARDGELADRIRGWRPDGVSEAGRIQDTRPVEGFLADAHDADGVCRNYTETFQAVWEVLRSRQSDDNHAMQNTYLDMPMGDCHIWIGLYTVQEDGTLLATQLDPTWADRADTDASNIEARLEGNSGGSYAMQRARFAFQSMHLGVNGVTPERIVRDYVTVMNAAHDLADRGQAREGARLIEAYLGTLPDVTRQDMAEWVQGDLFPRRARWQRPGHEALGRAWQALSSPPEDEG